jgi:branched-chain amino acid transport system substrate-binding protein
MKLKPSLVFIFVFAIVVLILDILGCERIERVIQPTSQPASLSGEIAIGVVSSQTGVLGPGTFGPGASVMENGLNMALQEINASEQLGDAQLKFVIEDDQSSIEGAVAAFNKLIHEDNVPLILGVWTSHIAKSVYPIAQENNVVALGSVLTATGLADVGDFVFRVANPISISVPRGIAITHERLGYQGVGIITDTVDAASRSADETYRTALADHGVEVLARETFETGKVDFTEQLTRIKAANPDVIFIAAQDIETILILQQAREIGIDVHFIRFIFSIDNAESAGDAAEGVITFADWVATAETPGNAAFIANYTAEYGTPPSVWAAQSYATVYILAEALSIAQSTDPTAIATALAEIKDFPTILGSFSFAPNGDPIYDPVVLIVKDGKLQVFE